MALYHVVFLLLSFLGILGNSGAENELNSRCSVLLRNGLAQCKTAETGVVSCVFCCQDLPEVEASCSEDRGWDRQLPPCIEEGKDFLSCGITLRNGFVLCVDEGLEGLQCLVYCDEEGENTALCFEGRGWSEMLPPCLSAFKVNSQCSLSLKNAAAVCHEVDRNEIACTLLCENRPQGFYSCSKDKGWNKALPACFSGPRDSLCNLALRNGTASCHVEEAGDIACSVVCAGEFQGYYRCKEGRGWDQTLPPCVKHLS